MKEWKRNKRPIKKGKEDEVALPCSALRAPPKNKNKKKTKRKRKVWKSISSPFISYLSPSFHLLSLRSPLPPCSTLHPSILCPPNNNPQQPRRRTRHQPTLIHLISRRHIIIRKRIPSPLGLNIMHKFRIPILRPPDIRSRARTPIIIFRSEIRLNIPSGEKKCRAVVGGA